MTMIIVLSPAKTLDYNSSLPSAFPESLVTKPAFPKETETLINVLKKKSVKDIQDLMELSKSLAELNVKRYQSFYEPKNPSRPALFAFKGDVYLGFQFGSYSKKEYELANKTVRMLSGLYGVLRAFDPLMPYRLEMGSDLAVGKTKNLYEFWRPKIAPFLQNEMENSGGELVNLASKEYYSAVDESLLKGKIIHINFQEKRGDTYKTMGMSSKRARGVMTDWAIRNGAKKAVDLKDFDADGYKFDPENSKDNTWMFRRDLV